jgi:hypothetical protein
MGGKLRLDCFVAPGSAHAPIRVLLAMTVGVRSDEFHEL